jgi:hypothetical protein
MKSFNLYELKHIGFTGNKFDIIYKTSINEPVRGIQIKTLSGRSDDLDSWNAKLQGSVYEDDTLLVLVNKNRNRFGLISYVDCQKTGITLSFLMGRSKYKNYMYSDEEKFKVDLRKKLNDSSIYDEEKSLIDTQKKERDMLFRLEQRCNEKKLTFEMNKKSNNIDCYINKNAIQCKFSSYEDNNLIYNVSISRHGNLYKESSDIKYFIIEIGDGLNNFYIIPIEDMIKKGYITPENEKGNKSISIASEKINHTHWSIVYLNRFDYFIKKKIFNVNDFIIGRKLKNIINNYAIINLIKIYLK